MNSEECVRALLETALRFVAASLWEKGGQRQLSTRPDWKNPIASVERLHTAPWASGSLEGYRTELTIKIIGEEDAVNAYAAALETHVLTPEDPVTGYFLAEAARVQTDMFVDGDGGAYSLVHFETLLIRE
ncbi:hypothetical protein [Pacificimonas flava]|uniref:hypothetical protein n=1 Tax=Pacificimonas flava TaxID=1234595 RepID=UPI000571F40B|nr:hypothetical protein [Pacificimonas flava]MBB5280922.1 hypothetical protein [Pacificimonas flava]